MLFSGSKEEDYQYAQYELTGNLMATSSKRIFIEASMFLAFIDRVNLNHAKASKIFEVLGRDKYQVFTSGIVLIQTFNALEQDLGETLARDFLQAILETKIQILYTNDPDLLAAFRYLKANPGRQISLSSIINANLIQRHNINSILTFDFWPNVMGIVVSDLITGTDI